MVKYSYSTKRKEKQMTVTKNPWNDILTKTDGDKKVIVAADDWEQIKDYLEQKNYQKTKEEYKLQLDVYPQHYVGNIKTAKIIVLSKNPGYSEDFKNLYEDNKDYQQTCLNNLQLKENEVKFHAFDLDQGDKFGYWGKKFKQWFKVVKTNDDLKKYSSWFSEYVALAEYFPYHSTQYDSKLDKSFNNKTSYLPTQQFLFNLISKRIVDKDDSVTIIITRSYNKWYEAIPQLKEYKNCYETSNPSNPSLKPENLLKVKRYSAKKEVEKVLDDSLKKL
jgi:hypothetical protein